MTEPGRRLLALSHLTALDAIPPDLVAAGAAAGFGAVGLRVWPAGNEPPYPMIGDTPMVRETVSRLRDTGMRVLDIEVLRLRPDSEPDEALRILDAGARLGAQFVLVIGNDTDESRLTERFASVCAAASARGLRAALEFMIFSAVKTLADAVRIIEGAAQPAAVLVDALHLQRSGGMPAEVAALPPERLPYAQVCDAPSDPVWPDEAQARDEARRDRLLPGDGALPLHALVDALPAGAPLAVEAPVAALAQYSPAERARLAFNAVTRVLAERDRRLGASR
jgi:sugar phosphate isomerase/epimerase